MSSFPVHLRDAWRFICAGAFIWVAVCFLPAGANSQAMRAGVHVDPPTTRSAVALPEADQNDATVVAITNSGKVFFGTTETTAEDLAEKLPTHPFHRPGTLFIKAAQRLPYATVAKVLNAIRSSGGESFVRIAFLTDQLASAGSSFPKPPTGLEILLRRPVSASAPIDIQMAKTGEQQPTLKLDQKNISSTLLESELKKAIHDRSTNIVLLHADAQSSFAEIAQVIDTCNSTGAKIVLAPPAL